MEWIIVAVVIVLVVLFYCSIVYSNVKKDKTPSAKTTEHMLQFAYDYFANCENKGTPVPDRIKIKVITKIKKGIYTDRPKTTILSILKKELSAYRINATKKEQQAIDKILYDIVIQQPVSVSSNNSTSASTSTSSKLP